MRAALQPATQLGHAGGEDEDVAPPLELLLELARPLAVDVQHQVDAVFAGDLQGRERRAVQVAVHLGPLRKGILRYHPLKLLAGDEEVINTVRLARTR